MKTLVLDAMGVIYAAADDVVELLNPFIHENGGITDDPRIEVLYHEASLGRLSASQFWEEVHLDPALENAYLLRHRLSVGLLEFLRTAKPRLSSIWCLSNDVSEWSRKLRDRFDLSRFIDGFVISGDVGVRKPDAAIFNRLLAQTGAKAENVVLVDDRLRNLDAAAALGFQTVLFGSTSRDSVQHHATTDFAQLLEYVCSNDGV
jgi:putative hydrolase of the HAD superfamily